MMKSLLLAAALLATSAVADKPRVAVLYFDYSGNNKDLEIFRKGLTQMLITDLAANDAITVVERVRLQEVMDELSLQQTNKVDPATAAKIGKLLGAKYLVKGGYVDFAGTVRLDAHLVEVETSAEKGVKATAKFDDFLDAESALARGLNEKLSDLATKDAAKPQQKTEAPKKPARLKLDTALKYARALDAADKKDKEGAKKQLQEVVKEQPDFALAALDLAALSK
jgi:TolB-like protein